MKKGILILSVIILISINLVSAFQLEKHLVQLEIDSNYPCHIENGDTIVCPQLQKLEIDSWQDKITNLKPEEKDIGKLKDTDKINYLKGNIVPYEGKTSKVIDITKEYREKVNIYSLDTEIKIGFATNVFVVSGTPLENFDVNTTTGMVRYRPLNMTWLNLGSSSQKVTINTGTINYGIDHSVSIWFNISGSASGYLFGWASQNSPFLQVSNGCIISNIRNTGAVNEYSSYCGLNDSKWHNIISTYNATQKNITLYADGVNVNVTNISGASVTGNTQVCLGDCASSSSLSFYADELRFYYGNGAVLNQTQVTSIYNSGRIRNDSLFSTNLHTWLPIEENTGTIAYDLSGNVRNGTITGATWQSDNINVTTLGYQVDISIVNIIDAYIVWDNSTIIAERFTGNRTFTFLNNDTIWIYENGYVGSFQGWNYSKSSYFVYVTNGSNYAKFNNSLATNQNVSFTSLTSALLTNSTSLCNGSTGLMTGNVNITLNPNEFCYVLDEFNYRTDYTRLSSLFGTTKADALYSLYGFTLPVDQPKVDTQDNSILSLSSIIKGFGLLAVAIILIFVIYIVKGSMNNENTSMSFDSDITSLLFKVLIGILLCILVVTVIASIFGT